MARRFHPQAFFPSTTSPSSSIKALEVRKLRDENRELREALGHKYQFANIIGHSRPMQEIFATIMRVAPTRATSLSREKAASART